MARCTRSAVKGDLAPDIKRRPQKHLPESRTGAFLKNECWSQVREHKTCPGCKELTYSYRNYGKGAK